ncbi:hypothetical protein F0M18_13435 [Pseudohalioglobus sediminis]|uniref:Uncharacterized protein n=1 Tax=Pseudohalioglobus sediminis TaxID=2606449 RepID=A0A5B0WSR4_9GAMM|nr:hypothetical protein [Pseudohalioglobus sediminis]KAA1190064.1 hypothetical protein F0M18_13435 [Pseudohalioglobus sediminis]
MNTPGTPTAAVCHAAPGSRFTLVLIGIAVLLLGGLLGAVLQEGAAFDSFAGRTIGISLLSDVDPHYRIGIFLLLSALAILASFALFTLSGFRPAWQPKLPGSLPGVVLVSCLVANGLAAMTHPDQALFLAGAAHTAFILAMWWWHGRYCRRDKCIAEDQVEPGTEQFLLQFCCAWQVATLILWLGGLQPGLLHYALTIACYLLLLRFAPTASIGRWQVALRGLLLTAPVLLIAAIEWNYFRGGESATAAGVLLRLLALAALALATLAIVNPGLRRLAWLGCLGVLMSTFIINQYDNTIAYRAYDMFHLAEKILPLQQWDLFRSIPYLDYHPGHGVFDMLPHGAYHALNNGDPLESLIWGNGYFIGWTVQTLYIALLFVLLARHLGTMTAFGLLWLLPVFHLFEPYNTLLLLPLFNLMQIARTGKPLPWWLLQWIITLGLVFWRTDFGLIVAAGNLISAAALSWHSRGWQALAACVGSALAVLVVTVLVVLATDPELIAERLLRWRDLMGIQLLAASYDHFYKEWTYMAWGQYIVLPALGALAGGYALAQVYLRRASTDLAVHLAIIFGTAIGFALSIRLFQRHSLVEGVIKTNFFVLMPVLALATFEVCRRWKSLFAIALVALIFITIPKTETYRANAPWSPRHSYPVSTQPGEFPPLVQAGQRLQNNVSQYDSFIDFSARYLNEGDAFYDFSNAPMLYVLAGIRLPNYVYETVWHTSETVQETTLAELEALRADNRLPFVVFRQNKPRWDALDGVDNALRSYRMAEYLYQHFRPCVRIGRFDIWTDKRRSCEQSIARQIPPQSVAGQDMQMLKRDYLQQDIAFGHLAYIWANYDEHPESLVASEPLPTSAQPSGALVLRAPGSGFCRRGSCYLELDLEATQPGEAVLRIGSRRQASFAVRPGTHRYVLRISALWRWHQGVGGKQLRLRAPDGASLQQARLLAPAT